MTPMTDCSGHRLFSHAPMHCSRTVHPGRVSQPGSRRCSLQAAAVSSVSAFLQTVSLLVFLVPNAYILANKCAWFSATVRWSAFVRWQVEPFPPPPHSHTPHRTAPHRVGMRVDMHVCACMRVCLLACRRACLRERSRRGGAQQRVQILRIIFAASQISMPASVAKT